MRDLPRGTVTLLFTDIEGSTRLLHELGAGYAEVLAEHRRVLREAFGRHGGVEVDTQGDAFFYAFERAADAVVAAADAQEALRNGRVRVRMGVHTGEPFVTEEGYLGVDVHRAARIMSAGHGGQVVVSERTRGHLDGDAVLIDLGLHRLKDLGEPEKLFQLGADQFPPLRTLDATNLPIAASPLLGRQKEIGELVPLLQDGARLLTITGPGGTGKTRLALQVAAELVGSLADGVFWVPLAGLKDHELVLPTIAQTIGATGDLADHLRGKQLLLLLDNAEHLLAAAPGLAELLTIGPKLRLLVTSRAPLHVSAEREYPLDPLAATDAATLFVERARAAGRALEADGTVEAICRRLDGLPLAVELAAARAKFLDPQTLLERLERALPLLTDGARDAPERQRTLRSTIEWSYDLLDEDERRTFRALGVFVGGCTIAAAEAVCDVELDHVGSLVNGSLVRHQDGRYTMLETIREFALEKLEESDALQETCSRHADYYLGLAEQSEPELQRADDREWLTRLDAERDNFRTSLVFAQEQRLPELALRLVAALRWYWSARGAIAEHRLWLHKALEHAGDTLPEQRADALQAAALNAYWAGDYEQTESYAEQMLETARRLGDREREVSALSKLGAAAIGMDQVQRSRALMEEALSVARELGRPARLALSLSNLAAVALREGDYARAAELCEESLGIGEDVLDSAGAAGAHLNLSEARLHLGDPAGAAESARESLQLAAGRKDPLLVAETLFALGAAVAAEDSLHACRLIGASAKLRREAGATLGPFESKLNEELLESLRQTLGGMRFDSSFEEGQALAFADAVELGLRTRPSSSSP